MEKNDSLAALRRPVFLPSLAHYKIFLCALLFCALPLALAQGAKLKEARVTQVIRDVKLLPGQAAPRPASISDQIREGTAVRTGLESRAELTFTDATLARLGANTIFSFDQGTRNLQLGGGAMLLRVPKNAGGAQINTAAITAAITGTTMLMEYHPNAYCKYIMLEGVARIFRKNKVGESVLLHAGQMLIVNPNGKGLPEPVDVDLDRLMKTSILITGFDPLPSLDLIAQEISQQDAQKKEGNIIDTNLVLYNGTIVSLLDPTNSKVTDQANANEERQPNESPTPTVTPTITPTVTPTVTPTITPTVTPTPSKFGTPTVIASSTPYAIGSGTVIQTDPSITTNGTTDFGKIYRGPAEDGSISTYLFTATSAFDNFIAFDPRFQVVDLLPLAVFKFSALQLTGNPTISLVNGGAPNLALISVGDITSGPPGGTLTFAGLASLILATQNGSITLTSDLAFQDIPSLGFYARGKGSDLTLDSAISGTTNVFLGAEGSIIANDPLTISQVNSGVNVGLFTVIFAGENFTLGNSLTLVNDNSGGNDLVNGGSIIINVGGDFSVAGANTLTLNVLNNGGSDIGIGGDISVTTGGDLTAGAIDALINNRDGGSIDDGVTLSFDIGGDLTTSGDATFVVSGRNDGLGGGTFASGVSVNLSAASISTGGAMDLAISVNAGGFASDAFLSVDVPGSVFANGGYFSEIQSTGFNIPGGPFIEGGMISGDALILLNFGSLSSGDVFDVEIDNFGLGTIGGEALLSVAVAGDLNAAGDIFTDIINTAANHNGVLSPGGTIGGDATVLISVGGDIIAGGVGEFAVLNNDLNFLSQAGTITGDANVIVDAVNITTGDFFQPLINNTNGSIGGNATIAVDVTDDISVGGITFFNLLNTNGAIGGEALSDLFATNFSSGSTFEFQILNDGGSIGGNAILGAVLSDSLTIGGDATIQIGNAGGSIAQDATIDISVGSFSANSLILQIDNTAGFIGGTSEIIFTTESDLTITNDGTLTLTIGNSESSARDGADISVVSGGTLTAGAIVGLIDNSVGGSLTSGGNLFVSTGGNLSTSTGGASFTIQNTDGTIDQGANLTLAVGGALTTQNLNLSVENFDFSANPAGHIGTGGNILVTTGGDLIADSIDALINNRSGGTIDSGGNMTFSVGGALTTIGDAGFNISTRLDPFPNGEMSGSVIGSDVTLAISAGRVDIGGSLSSPELGLGSGISNRGSTIDGSATYSWTVTGDISIQGDAAFSIFNSLIGSLLPIAPSTIGGSAVIAVQATNVTVASFLINIDNFSGGIIGSNAILTTDLGGNLTSLSGANFDISNNDREDGRGGGMIGGAATIDVTVGGNISAIDSLVAVINNSGGTIGNDAAITLSAGSLSAGSLLAQIDNLGGTIGGSATINSTFTGAVTVSGDANLNIFGSDTAAGGAAINFNGGTYSVGGTFLSTIDGDGAITFNNAAINADVLKSGVFGNNGTLTVGGGRLSGSTQLKLYAPGSNGKVNFISNVTLDSESSVIIAANAVTINNGVVVTITGDDGVSASVFTNVPNYTGSGGNDSTTGMFAGNGAETFPLDQAPPFDALDAPGAPATAPVTAAATPAPIPTTNSGSPGVRGAGAIRPRGHRPVAIARVANSNELLDLAERVTSGSSGRGQHNSKAPGGRASQGAEVSLGKGHSLPVAPNAVTADLTLRRNEIGRTAALP